MPVRHASAKRHCLALLLIMSLMLLLPLEAMAQANPFGAPGRGGAEQSGIIAWLLIQQAMLHHALVSGMRAVGESREAMLALLGVAFGYGVVHAIGPGHGKAVIASYLVANETALKRGIGLAFGAAFVQATIALTLVGVLVMLMGRGARDIDATAAIIETIGFLLVLGMGLALFWRKARLLWQIWRGVPVSDAACGHDHACDIACIAPEMLAKASLRDLALVAVGAGIRPCTGAIILLVFALSQGLFLLGVLAVAAMAFGTALGTSLFATLAVKTKSLALALARRSSANGSLRFAPLVLEALAGLLLALFGLALLLGAVQAGG